MPDLLKWGDAEKRHREELQHFICAIPERPIKDAGSGWVPYHPRFWEFDVQLMVRGLGRKVPPPRETTVLVGENADGLAAVSCFTRLDGPSVVHLDLMAVSVRLRGQGGAYAREMVRTTLERIEADAIDAGGLEMKVVGEIYKDNVPCLRLVHSFGLNFVEEAETGAQTWALRFPLAAIDD